MSRRRSRLCWDKHAIKAEIHRRGGKLTQIAVDSGLEPSACRVALVRRNFAGERAIAAFLAIPPVVLWPERYETSNAESNAQIPACHGQISEAA